MKAKTASGFVLAILLIGLFVSTFSTRPVRAWTGGTITINMPDAPGINPPDAPIKAAADGYVVTDDIESQSNLGIETFSDALDGAGHSIRGSGSTGFDGFGARATPKNLRIDGWKEAIHCEYRYAMEYVISKNVILNCATGIAFLGWKSTIAGNSIRTQNVGIDVMDDPVTQETGNNELSENTIYAPAGQWIRFHEYGGGNRIYHNNFMKTSAGQWSLPCGNTWDNGYPSGGNYWSDYVGVDHYKGPNQNIPGADGIGDTPYVIDANNKDRYPLMKPWPLIIFKDGFESGSFSKWTGRIVTSGETAAVIRTGAYRGVYIARFTSNGGGAVNPTLREYAYCYKNIASSSDLYARGYFYVTQSGVAQNDDRFNFLTFFAPSTGTYSGVAHAGWRMKNGVTKWCLTIRQGTGYVDTYSTATPALNRIYCVELHWKKGLTTGMAELWVNGVKVCSTTGKNTAAFGNAVTVWFGLGQLYGCGPTKAYCDCCVISKVPIGPEP